MEFASRGGPLGLVQGQGIMTKLKWEKKSDSWEIAWLGHGIDASNLDVDATVDPSKGVKWSVWYEGGFEPTMEEAKLACEAAVERCLLSALTQLVTLPKIQANLGKLRDKWHAKSNANYATCNAMHGPNKTVRYDQDKSERLATEANIYDTCANELTEALDWVDVWLTMMEKDQNE